MIRLEEQEARRKVLEKLGGSRAELRQLLDPPRPPGGAQAPGGEPAGGWPDGFPRSRTMRLLTSGKGLGTVGALVAGLLMSRPALALKLLRLLPFRLYEALVKRRTGL